MGRVVVGLAGVLGELAAQDGLELIAGELPASGLRGAEAGPAPAKCALVAAGAAWGAATASALSMAAMAVRSAVTASVSRAFMAAVRSRRRVARSAAASLKGPVTPARPSA